MLDLMVKPIERQTGRAFPTSDLLLLRAWSEFHGLTMRIDLDHETAGVACEEAVQLTEPEGDAGWLLWRDGERIALRPEGRPTACFASVPDALHTVMPALADALTDIHPTGW